MAIQCIVTEKDLMLAVLFMRVREISSIAIEIDTSKYFSIVVPI